jgi:hypothetical protein
MSARITYLTTLVVLFNVARRLQGTTRFRTRRSARRDATAATANEYASD